MRKIIHSKKFVPYISADEIQERVQALAAQINKDYEGEEILFLAILNGSFMFAADLFKHLEIDASISFIKLASYKGTSSTGKVITAIGLEEHLVDKHIIVVEDIIDTGRTMHHFLPELKRQQPKSIKIASFLSKPDALKFPIFIDYLGFDIPNKFVVGYGLDFDGLGRNISELLQIEE